jgi:hypothetical protein
MIFIPPQAGELASLYFKQLMSKSLACAMRRGDHRRETASLLAASRRREHPDLIDKILAVF